MVVVMHCSFEQRSVCSVPRISDNGIDTGRCGTKKKGRPLKGSILVAVCLSQRQE